MSELNLTKENFDKEVLASDVPVLVDFWATWCGPCQMMSPIVEELAKEIHGAKVAKINVDEAQEIAEKYDIMSIPAFKIFKNGKVVAEINGAVPKQILIDKIEEAKK